MEMTIVCESKIPMFLCENKEKQRHLTDKFHVGGPVRGNILASFSAAKTTHFTHSRRF